MHQNEGDVGMLCVEVEQRMIDNLLCTRSRYHDCTKIRAAKENLIKASINLAFFKKQFLASLDESREDNQGFRKA